MRSWALPTCPPQAGGLADCLDDRGPNRRFVVTNLAGTPQELYDFYAMRGECENRIKKLKDDLKADRLSCHRFVANQLRLLLHAAAYALLYALKKYLKGTVLEKAQTCREPLGRTIGTIRGQLIKTCPWPGPGIGARVVQSCRRLRGYLASGYPLKNLFFFLYHRLTAS